MCAKACAKTHEPKIAVSPAGLAQRLLEREQDGGAAHVAVVPERPGARLQGMGRDDRRQRLEDVAAAGVRDDARDGPRSAPAPEPAEVAAAPSLKRQALMITPGSSSR